MRPEQVTKTEIVAWLIVLALVGGLIAYALKAGAEVLHAYTEYVEATIDRDEDEYHRQVIADALKEQREAKGVHPETGAEMPPYWTAPEESY